MTTRLQMQVPPIDLKADYQKKWKTSVHERGLSIFSLLTKIDLKQCQNVYFLRDWAHTGLLNELYDQVNG